MIKEFTWMSSFALCVCVQCAYEAYVVILNDNWFYFSNVKGKKGEKIYFANKHNDNLIEMWIQLKFVVATLKRMKLCWKSAFYLFLSVNKQQTS